VLFFFFSYCYWTGSGWVGLDLIWFGLTTVGLDWIGLAGWFVFCFLCNILARECGTQLLLGGWVGKYLR